MASDPQSSALLDLPFLMPDQALKYVTHNQALLTLDALVQLAVIGMDLATPPADPAEGDRYIVAAGASEGWTDKVGQVAAFTQGAWRFFVPRPGWRAYVAGKGRTYLYRDGGWIDAATEITKLQNLAALGIGTTADSANPFAARLNAALLTALYASDGGSGDLRMKLNKEQSAGTATLLYQVDFSGRAELGLAGNDDFSVKVSANGDNWTEALRTDAATGAVAGRFFDSRQIVVGYRAVAAITPPSTGGIVMVMAVDTTAPEAQSAAIFAYNVSDTPALVTLMAGTAVENQGTAALTGTTGTAGSLALAAANGALSIENQLPGGTDRQMSVVFLGGYRQA